MTDAPPRPAILAVEDDDADRQALHRDLEGRYGDRFRLVEASTAQQALDTLRTARTRNHPIALVLSAWRVSDVDGIDLLIQARTLHPDLRRVLTVPYAQRDAARVALSEGQVDDVVVKPWQPPEQNLYPVLDDLLDSFSDRHLPPFTGVRVIGHRWAPDVRAVRDFLARYQVPYQWLEVETEPEAQRVLESTGIAAEGDILRALPIVVLPDGTVLRDPPVATLAAALGLTTTTPSQSYDVVIIGGGPAGLAAAVYAASEGLRAAVVERGAPGGQAALSGRIENYLGFPSGLSGTDLARRGLTQVRRFGADVIAPASVESLEVADTYRVARLSDGQRLSAEAVIVACGVSYRRLPVPGADELTNRGVYYGASSADAPFCAGEDIAIVGGANSAGQAAITFSTYARTVTLLVREDSLARGMSAYLVDRIERNPKVDVRTCTEVQRCIGTDHLEAVEVRDNRTGDVDRIGVTTLLVYIGAVPCTDWLDGTVDRDENGYLLTGSDLGPRHHRTAAGAEREPFMLETSVPGVFAAGDVRHRSMKRVASAVGEGSTAVSFIHRYLDR